MKTAVPTHAVLSGPRTCPALLSTQGVPQPCWTSQAWTSLPRAPHTQPRPLTLATRAVQSSPVPQCPCLMMNSCLWVRKRAIQGKRAVQGQPVGASSALHWKAGGGHDAINVPSLYWVKPGLAETKNKVCLAEGKAGRLWLPGRGG